MHGHAFVYCGFTCAVSRRTVPQMARHVVRTALIDVDIHENGLVTPIFRP